MEQLAPVGPDLPGRHVEREPRRGRRRDRRPRPRAHDRPYPGLERTADTLIDGLRESFDRHGVAATINRSGSLCSVFFTDGPVTNFEQAKAADHERYARFFHHLLDRGVALPPSGYELWTLGTAHGDAELERVLDAAGTFPG